MSDKSSDKNIHREFELERMILFSDAVFAIAITLLIIDIKFPELPPNYKVSLNLLEMFAPALAQFVGFAVSFFFIGVSWAAHLRLFRYLKAYDNGVIARNLVSLFFVVAFPFAASGLPHSQTGFVFPVVIYIGNIMFINLANFFLAHYIFKQKPALSIAGFTEEKKYLYLDSKMTSLALLFCFLVILAVGIITNFDSRLIQYTICSSFIVMGPVRIWLKKQRPKKVSSTAA